MPKREPSKYYNRPRSKFRWENTFPLEDVEAMAKEETKRLGKIFRDVRLMRGAQQADVAKWAGINPALLTKFENGYHMPQGFILVKIAVALGIHLSITLYKPNEYEQPTRQPRLKQRLSERTGNNGGAENSGGAGEN